MNKSEFFIKGSIRPDIICEYISMQNMFPNRGAVSIFLGQVRNDLSENGVKTKEIFYSCYKEMAEFEINKLINYIIQKYNDVKEIVIKHSENSVKCGEISLFVLVAGGHRIQIMEACSELVNLLKERVPIWKKEIYEDSNFLWT